METKNLIIGAIVLYILYQFFLKKEGYGDMENNDLEKAINARNEANRVYEEALTNKIKADYLAEIKKNEIDNEVNQIKVKENNKMLEAEMKAKEAEMKASNTLVNPEFKPLPVSMMPKPTSPFGPQPNISRPFFSPDENQKRLQVQQKVDMLAKEGLPFEKIMNALTEEEMMIWKKMAM